MIAGSATGGRPGDTAGRGPDVEDLRGAAEIDVNRVQLRAPLATTEPGGGDEEVEQDRFPAGLGDEHVAAGAEARQIKNIVVSGNTTMAHLLLQMEPRYIRREPYIPTMTEFPILKAGEIGLKANPIAAVFMMPAQLGPTRRTPARRSIPVTDPAASRSGAGRPNAPRRCRS